MADPKKIYLRFSKTSDFDKISEFYDVNGHKNVLKRDPALVRRMVEDGAVFLAEDDKGNIVAASVTYAHKTTGKDGVEHVQWQEIGTTRIALNGYGGLFDAMISMQSLRAFLVEPPENVLVSQMETTPVQTLAGKLGWRRMDGEPPQELLDGKAKTVPDGHATSNDWFFLGKEAIPVMAKAIDKLVDNPVVKNKKTGEEIELDFSRSSFVTLFRAEIKQLATRDFGDIDKPDPRQNAHEARDKWLKQFFR